MAKKMNLAAESQVANGDDEIESVITDALLLELCPKEFLADFKKAKTQAARADFLYSFDKGPLKAARDYHNKLDKFGSKLEAWFIQELPETKATGVTGKLGRVEIKDKEVAAVEDWDKFYGNVKKKNEFELMNRAINQKAIKERWEAGKEVPGVKRFVRKVISLTAAKVKK